MLRWLGNLFRRRRRPNAVVRPATKSQTTRAIPVFPPSSITPDDLDIICPPQEDLAVLDPFEIDALETTLLEEITRRKISLPPFPATAARVFELVEQPEIDLNKLVTALHWEPAIAAEILRLANSARFARSTDDLRSAVLTLGMAEVSSIVAGLTADSLFEVESKMEYELYPALWSAAYRESLAEAFTASWLAQWMSVARPDRVFLRTILEGVARALSLRALAGMILEGKQAMPSPEVITLAIDGIQPKVAEVVLARWSLPPSIASVVDVSAEDERHIVKAVRTLVELKRSANRDPVAARFGILARRIRLDIKGLRGLVRELESSAARVSEMLDGAPKAALAAMR
jgi:HD-like signal output (HDOD) protein